MKDYVHITLDLLFGFVGLFVFNQALGKAHFSQLTPFEFVAILVLGDLVGNAVYHPDVTALQILYGLFVWGIIIYAIGRLTLKSRKMRTLFEGEPSIVIRRGELQYDVMRRNMLDLNQLLSLLRQQGYFSLREIDYAVLETNGMISVLPKQPYGKPTRRDFGLNGTGGGLPITLILDGELQADNLGKASLSEPWLRQQLAEQGIESYESVLYADWDPEEGLFVIPFR
ncbi:MAG: hypothetical protein A9Z00_02135 [Thermobacillus sp. ZCTH02-B1]|uniref:DUF421 domain-containing protein n=1 Tax=Thermobacillus sp. ZCTH02-B1 TaxID=1858795 RepID=UPI000B572D77|nr:DUF421 domain-containing protein [Thermobacillus sp. ZCTH02-B1]OUM94384.1 MAG: hypothetical protein A9Z00_02135 [Thermobacillus sp. ZCTH02-B1]